MRDFQVIDEENLEISVARSLRTYFDIVKVDCIVVGYEADPHI